MCPIPLVQWAFADGVSKRDRLEDGTFMLFDQHAVRNLNEVRDRQKESSVGNKKGQMAKCT